MKAVSRENTICRWLNTLSSKQTLLNKRYLATNLAEFFHLHHRGRRLLFRQTLKVPAGPWARASLRSSRRADAATIPTRFPTPLHFMAVVVPHCITISTISYRYSKDHKLKTPARLKQRKVAKCKQIEIGWWSRIQSSTEIHCTQTVKVWLELAGLDHGWNGNIILTETDTKLWQLTWRCLSIGS